MSNADALSGNPYASFGDTTVAEAVPAARLAFIRKTYSHLAMAIYALAALEWAYFQTGAAKAFGKFLMENGFPFSALGVFGGFMVVSWIAHSWAEREVSLPKQYVALVVYVLAQSVLIAPLLWIAQDRSMAIEGFGQVNVIGAAALTTFIMFAGLTAIAWFSGTDFSFMGAGLRLAGFALMATIAANLFIGLNLGLILPIGIIVFASAYILYDTSNVIHHYRPDQYVVASLSLFSSVVLLFWYVLRLFLAFSSDD